ncbi:MAG: hypothetical protein JSV79_07960, partial [Armatimonadota bacterium]
MAAHNDDRDSPVREGWEEEVFAQHRWGSREEEAAEEHARLRDLWKAAQPLTPVGRSVVDGIVALEICNWNLEESILELCAAIGAERPPGFAIGHLGSVSEERWKTVWAYYLAVRDWLLRKEPGGYAALLGTCDAEQKIRTHVSALLGEMDDLKELYAERFCLCLEFWLGGMHGQERVWTRAHEAAVSRIEEEIKKLDPTGQILGAMHLHGDGRLQPCNHKAFRRYDIIISSIGAGEWRAAMPMRGTDGIERATLVEKYLSPIEAWVHGRGRERRAGAGELFDRVYEALGEADDFRLFSASLLVSLLRSQQLAARKRGESRMG